jgi:hypothetical protein
MSLATGKSPAHAGSVEGAPIALETSKDAVPWNGKDLY